MSSCPRCGAPLPADGSPCPRCLMELGQSVDPQAETTALPPEEPAGELGSIGPYRLLAVLGEGGMGTVYLAEQRQPIQRRVALKLVRAGLAGKEALARFEAERQALALMTHPGIARVLDAGTTAEGAPYFVMEYVHGEPINSYCDRKRLSTAERIDLFRAVCAAVQHAHQRGILHRDLKPSNILVEEVDGEPRPRIIDFGLAKALHQRLTERTLFTERGQIVGTPEYMSPEQAAGEAFDVDTTTDVYSLGVVLYELLTGSLPHDPQKLRDAGWLGMMKILREEEPKKPSTRVSTLNDETASLVAEKRLTEPKSLRRSLSGDIDWILLRALDKERQRRYANVSDLAADLERHLTSQPVEASPPSIRYLARKFVRRHRLAVGFAATVALLLVAFAVTMVFEARRLARERDRAVAAEKKAESEAETAKRVTAFLVELFEVVDPSESRGNSITAREVLDRGAKRIQTELAHQPAIQATLQDTLGRVYFALGLYTQAEPFIDAALANRRRLFGERSTETARSLFSLGRLKDQVQDYGPAARALRQSLALQRELSGSRTLEVAATMDVLGGVLLIGVRTAESIDEAEGLARESLALRRELLGAEHSLVAQSLTNLGGVLSWGKHDFAAAEPILQQALTMQRKLLGNSHPAVYEACQSLANHFSRKGDSAAAANLYREAIDVGERVWGVSHPFLATALNDFGNVLADRGEFAEATRYYRRAIDCRRKATSGADDPQIAFHLGNLALAERALGLDREAESNYREAIATLRGSAEVRGDWLARGLDDLAALLVQQRRLDEAEALLREGIELAQEAPVRDEGMAPLLSFHRAELLSARGRGADAAELCAQIAKQMVERLGVPGKPPKEFTKQSSMDARTRVVLGGCWLVLGRFAEAEPLLLDDFEDAKGKSAETSIDVREARERLVRLYSAWGKPDEAAKWRSP